MKRLLTALLASFASLAASAWNPEIRDIDIKVTLQENGTARIVETWDVTVASGTEWYLVRDNLDDIRISGLSVSDETGRQYYNEGEWDVDRSIEAKAGRCGIVTKRNGCEICWGVGSYGYHVFTVDYTMSNLVKSLNDYDMLLVQFISPGLSARPQHCRITIRRNDGGFTDEDSAYWGFGFNGTINIIDGAIVAESDEPFGPDGYANILARFNKGLFAPASVRDEDFESVRNEAFKGSAYREFEREQRSERIGRIIMVLFFGVFILISILGTKAAIRKRNRNLFGCDKIKDIIYDHGITFNGNLFESRYILEKCGLNAKPNAIAGAIILKMVKEGYINLINEADGKVSMSFNDSREQTSLRGPERELYAMMKDASGSDSILQDREFSRWSKRHPKRVTAWAESLTSDGSNCLREDGYAASSRLSDEGQAHARRVIGFEQYLKDYTLIKERASQEVALWQDYIIFAALYGIADKVAKELKDINPQIFEQVVGVDYPTMNRVVYLSNNMANSITNTVVRAQTATSVGGHGGFTSIGGGGGFSGGGFGGGSR